MTASAAPDESPAAPKPAPAESREPKSKSSTKPNPNAVSQSELAEIRLVAERLSRLEATAALHEERATDYRERGVARQVKHRKHTSSANKRLTEEERATKRETVVAIASERAIASRAPLIGRLERYRLSKPTDTHAAEALALLAQLHQSQADSSARVNESQQDAVFNRGQRWALRVWLDIIDKYPEYSELEQVLAEASEAAVDVGRHRDAKFVLRLLLCSNHRDKFVVARKKRRGRRATMVTQLIGKGGRLSSYDPCEPLVKDKDVVEQAWMRLGSVHQQENEPLLAASAYEQLTSDSFSSSYFPALRELAKVYESADKLAYALAAHDDIVVYVDRNIDEPRSPRDMMISIRADSVKRIGRIVAELWRSSAISTADATLRLTSTYYRDSRLRQRHVPQVFEAIGDALRGFGAYEQILPLWRFALDTWPTDTRSIVVSHKLIQVLVAKGDAAAAEAERQRFAERFARESPWYKAHAKDAFVMRAWLSFLERNMLAVLEQKTVAADELWRTRKWGKPMTAEVKASQVGLESALKKFVSQFPSSAKRYEMAFKLAQTEERLKRYARAAARYKVISRMRGAKGHLYEDAIRRRTSALYAAIRDRVAGNTLKLPALPTATAIKQGRALGRPPLVVKLQEAYDVSAKVEGSEWAAARSALRAAEYDLRYLRLVPAARRLRSITRKYCKTASARQAQRYLHLIYGAQGNTVEIANSQRAYAAKACGAQVDMLPRAQHAFSQGETLQKRGKHRAAADKFFRAMILAPRGHPFRATATLRAGLAKELAGDPSLARSRLRNFLSGSLQTAPEYAPALWHLAELYRRSFLTQDAAKMYVKLADLAQQSGFKAPVDFDLAGKARIGLLTAATLLEQEREYYDRKDGRPGAGSLYLRLADAESSVDKATKLYLDAARVYQRVGNAEALQAVYDKWVARFAAGNKELSYSRIEFEYRIAKVFEGRGDLGGARKRFQELTKHKRLRSIKRYAERTKRLHLWDMVSEAHVSIGRDVFTREIRPVKMVWPESGKMTDVYKANKTLLDSFKVIDKLYNNSRNMAPRWKVATLAFTGQAAEHLFRKALDSISVWIAKRRASGKKQMRVVQSQRQQLEAQLKRLVKMWTEAIKTARTERIENEWTRRARQKVLSYIELDELPGMFDEIVLRERTP